MNNIKAAVSKNIASLRQSAHMTQLEFAERLRDCGVQFEMHVYPHGEHGLALALDREDVRGWADLAANWVLKNI